jgi:hypothetical protein
LILPMLQIAMLDYVVKHKEFYNVRLFARVWKLFGRVWNMV